MSTADILFSVFDRLKDLIQKGVNARKAERLAVTEALTSAVNIANRTIRYIARRRNGDAKDPQEESALSQGWAEAGGKLLQVPTGNNAETKKYFNTLANRFFLKAQYWSDPESWTDTKVDAAKICLDELAKEARETLLASL